MGWFANLFSRKSQTMALDSAALLELMARMGGGMSGSGVSVTPETAMSVSAVYACTGVLCESVAQLPCHLYTGSGTDDRERVSSRTADLLNMAPNEWQTAFEFWEQAVLRTCLTGASYAVKGTVGAPGREVLAELMPVPTGRVALKRRVTGAPYWVIRNDAGNEKEFEAEDLFRITYRSMDGLTGLSPISYNRETIGNQIAGTQAQAGLMKRGSRVSGVLQHPGKLDEKVVKRLREQWDELYSGTANAGKTAILEEGMKFERTTLSNADIQYIEQRKLTSLDICSIYRVPPHMVANLDRATFSNIEQSAIEFVVHTMVPWLRRIEAAIKRDLLTPLERKTQYPEFLVDALLRGDSTARGQFYRELFATGAITANQICRRENLPTAGADGDTRYVPGNLMKLGRESINGDRPPKQ